MSFIASLMNLVPSNNTLEFVAAPALEPAEVAVDAVLMARYAEELKQVRELFILLSRTLGFLTYCTKGGSRSPPRRR